MTVSHDAGLAGDGLSLNDPAMEARLQGAHAEQIGVAASGGGVEWDCGEMINEAVRSGGVNGSS